MKLHKKAIGAVLVFWILVGFIVALMAAITHLVRIYGDWVFGTFLFSLMFIGFSTMVYLSVVGEDSE